MTAHEHQQMARLQRRYPGLEFVDKGQKSRFDWLRFQAHHVVTEMVNLPPIHRVRSAFMGSVTLRRLVAFGSSLEEVEQCLAKAA